MTFLDSIPPPKRLNAPADRNRAKQTAHLAFLAHQAAVIDGDRTEAEAANLRFLTASNQMKGRKGNV